jgi:hypothetical protein
MTEEPTLRNKYDSLFQYYGQRYKVDWLLLKAQLYVHEKSYFPWLSVPGIGQSYVDLPQEPRLAYLAGLVDELGRFALFTKEEHGTLLYNSVFGVFSDSKNVVDFLCETFLVGTVADHNHYSWVVTGRDVVDTLGLLAPYLVKKRAAASVLLYGSAPDTVPLFGLGYLQGWCAPGEEEDEFKTVASLLIDLQAGRTITTNDGGFHTDDLPYTPVAHPLFDSYEYPDMRLRIVGQKYWSRALYEAVGSEIAFVPDLRRHNPFDIEDAIRVQAQYLNFLFKYYREKMADEVILDVLLPAYYWGIENLNRLVQQYGSDWRERLPQAVKHYWFAVKEAYL